MSIFVRGRLSGLLGTLHLRGPQAGFTSPRQSKHERDELTSQTVALCTERGLPQEESRRAWSRLHRLPAVNQRAVRLALGTLGGRPAPHYWHKLPLQLGALDPTELLAAVPLALRLCHEDESAPGRARMAHFLLTRVPDAEREAFVNLAARVWHAPNEDIQHPRHPLRQLAATPAAQRVGLVDAYTRIAGIANKPASAAILESLRRVAPQERDAFTTLVERLFDVDSLNFHLHTALRELASLRMEDRIATVAFVVDLIPRGITEARRARVVMRLMLLPRGERDNVTTACAVLAPLPIERRIVAATAILNTPIAFRISHAHRQVSAYMLDHTPEVMEERRALGIHWPDFLPNVHGHAQANTENVMNATTIARVSQAVRMLLRNFPNTPARGTQLRAIERYVARLHECTDDAQKDVVMRVRGGATEQRNALRVLKGAARPGDFSHALNSNDPYTLDDGSHIGMGDLAGLVWFVIDHHRDATPRADARAQRAVMRYGLFCALAQCIEDDGHRVCGVGFAQRLLRVLQGYVPGVSIDEGSPRVSPQAFVTFVTARWTQRLAGRVPTAKKIRAFHHENVQAANALYGEESAEARMVAEHLGGYLDLTYLGWQA